MESKNFIQRENDVQRAYFCHLQVSNKFMRTMSPLRRWENGFIRIERTSGRHQSILLPVIDYRGIVKIDGK